VDDSFLLMFNALDEDRTFMLPRRRFGARWALELSTAEPGAEPGSAIYGARTEVPSTSRSIIVLKRAG
jgi:pullulanase/glycogen debranching enzyme